MTTNETPSSKDLTLVIGSTGKTGRRVFARLEAQGVPIRHGSRQAPIPFDWDDQATWAPALAGVKAVYVAFHPDLSVPGAPEAIGEFTRLATKAGVDRLVLLSGRGEAEAQRCEQIVAESGLTWTVVRASWFLQNFSEGFMLDQILSGTVALPAGRVLEPFVDAEDIADVAVAALMGTDLENQVVEVTGPRLLTLADAIGEIAAATGREITFIDIGHDEFLASMHEAGVPAAYVELLDYLFREVMDGRNASLAPGVREALGREPRDLKDYVERTLASGAWAGEVVR